MAFRVLISAGEASGDLYAAHLATALKARVPNAEFFGCAGPRMRERGVRPVVDASRLAVVGLVEVLLHIPRIYGEYRTLCRAIAADRPDVAILTDSPDFHLRIARYITRLPGRPIPVIYLVAPQAWAWRKGRLPKMRRVIDRLLCIFPFEEEFFRRHGIETTYIGHPLAHLVRASTSRAEFFARHGLPSSRPLVALLPGSRHGEASRHLPAVLDAADLIQASHPASFVLALPRESNARERLALSFWERIRRSSIKVIEGETWDALAHADLALAASGTVTVEAALLGAPMVTYYRVTALSWLLGKLLLRVPFYSMVNLVAGRKVVPELMQNEMTAGRLASEALRLLGDPQACAV
ncbi:MAG: lipid-A-disaccharide synthase, partial [Pseudomonadota bacterium]